MKAKAIIYCLCGIKGHYGDQFSTFYPYVLTHAFSVTTPPLSSFAQVPKAVWVSTTETQRN